jgi:hypothetical protein
MVYLLKSKDFKKPEKSGLATKISIPSDIPNLNKIEKTGDIGNFFLTH